MKFFTAAVATFLLSMAATEAKTFSREELDARIMAGKVDKKTILNKAIPYKQYLRRVEEGQGGEDGEDQQANGDYDYYNNYNYNQTATDYAEDMYGDSQIEDEDYERIYITEDTSIKFNSCVVMQTQNYNLYMDNLINMAKQGRIASVRNYVLFELCTGNSCNNRNWFGNKSDNLYMIDLPTFIEAAIAYGPSEKERTCQACQNFANICGYDGNGNYYQNNADADGNYDADQDQDGNNSRRRRKLEGVAYELFDGSTCNKCAAFDCWYDNEGDQEVDAEAIEEWVLEINDCRESQNAHWNGLNLYSGWMCSEDTTGIELGVFLDPYCRMQQKSISFTSIMEDSDYQYVYQSQDIIPMMFDITIGCGDTENAEYVDYDTWTAMGQDNGNGNGNDYDDSAAKNVSELCQTIFYGEFAPRALENCGTPMNITAEMIADATEAEYQDQNGQDQTGQNMYQYMQSQQMLYNNYGRGDEDWQHYDLSAQDVLDGAATCAAVSSKVGATQESSGNGWGSNLPWRSGNSAMSTPSARLTPFEIAWIVLTAVIATALFMHYTRKQIVKRRKRANENEKEVYQRTSDKGSPLIIS
jgi:hypothetical protein